MYVPIDWQIVVGLDKLRQFSGARGVQHLDMPNLMGRNRKSSGTDPKAESEEEFDFVTAEEDKAGYEGRYQTKEPKPKPNKGELNPRRVERSGPGHGLRWLKEEDKSKKTNSDKSGNGLETTDSLDQFDLDKLNHLKAR